MSATAIYEIQPVERFSGPTAVVRRPKEFACFSYDDNHQYYPDERSLRYYYPPKTGCELSSGFNGFHQHDDSQDEHLDSLLRRLMEHERAEGSCCKARIVTWRGMLTKVLLRAFFSRPALSHSMSRRSLVADGEKIMASPYDDSSFEMNATRFQDTLFIEEHHAFKTQMKFEQSRWQPRKGMPSQDVMSFWGYKFETLSTLPVPWQAAPRELIEGRDRQMVSNYAQYCSIVRTAVGGTEVVLGGEVDAIWDQKPMDTDDSINWVELKTSAIIENDRDMVKYERKLMKFWIQSFLLGVPRIVVGFRSKTGTLQHLEELETQKIPAMVDEGIWSENVCINFTAEFLAWLVNTVEGEGVWRICRRKGSAAIEVLQTEPKGSGNILSEEFIQWRNSHGT